MDNRVPRRALISYLTNYLIFLISILCISLLIFLFFYKRNKETIDQYNEAFLLQSSKILDERFSGLKRDTVQFAAELHEGELLDTDFTTAAGKLAAFQLSKGLNTYVYLTPYVRHCYLFLIEADLVITDSGLYTRRQYFDLKLSSDCNYAEWLDLLSQGKEGQTTGTVFKEEGTFESLYLYRPVPNVPSKAPRCIFVQSLDESVLENTDRGDSGILPGELHILGPGGSFLFPGNPDIAPGEREDLRLALATEESVVITPSHMTSITPSDETDHYYLYRFPRKSYYRNLSYYWYLVGLFLLLFLVAGLFLSWLFARRRGGDIGSIFDSLGIQETGKGEDPIHRITVKAHELMERDRINEEEKLFHTDLSSVDWTLMGCDGFSEKDSFASLYLEMEDAGFASGDSAGSLIMKNLENDTAPKAVKSFVRGEFLVTFFSARSGIDDLPAYARALANRLNQNYGIVLSGGVGRWHRGFRGMGESLREAKKASSYRKFSGPGRITRFDEIGTLHSESLFPTELKQRLVMEVRAGRSERSAAILDQLFDECFPSDGLLFEKAESFFHELRNMALSLAESLEEVTEEGRREIRRALFSLNDKGALKDYLATLLENICREVRNNKKNAIRKTGRKDLIEFVDENITDPGLDLNRASENFSLSPYYFSALFKEEVGRNFKDYIRSQRVARAKSHIKKGASMADTALLVGYANETALYRNFKKETGQTPGFYKKLSEISLAEPLCPPQDTNELEIP